MKALIVILFLCQNLCGFSLRSDIEHAYRHQRWPQVEKLSEQLLSLGSTRHYQTPDFYGQIYFKMGVALWHQGKWKRAGNILKVCYSRFHNRLSNPNRLQALLGWSDCEHRLGNYAASIRIAKRYLLKADTQEWRRSSPFANGPHILGHDPFYR